jgi:protein MpaA
MQKLGRNHGRYRGESIDIHAVLADCHAAAGRAGWTTEVFSTAIAPPLVAFHRAPKGVSRGKEGMANLFHAPRRIYLSTGIHGDEPAGPLAIRQLLIEDRWPADAELLICPCLNPTGFPLNQRESAAGVDLNRDYRKPQSAEVRAHLGWLARQGVFDLTICLHEDWESHGFYLYEVNPDGRPSAAPRMISAVEAQCPIDRSAVIEGRPADGGIIRPQIDLAGRPDWPEAFYLITHHTRLSYTLEAPSDFPLGTRVTALTTAVNALLTTGPSVN